MPFTQPAATAASPAISALLQGQYDNTLACIRCGLCLSVCPTYQISFAEEEGPRGRIAMARALTEGQLPITPDLRRHSEQCLLCDACTAVCPAGVRMEPLGTMLREVLLRTRRQGLRERVLRWLVFSRLFGSAGRFRFACRLGWLYQRSGLRALLRRSGLLRLLGLAAAERLLPDLPRHFFVARGQHWRPAQAAAERTVAVFAGCIMSTAFAATDAATARLLARSRAEVVAPSGQGCCGALHVHNGEAEGARRLARRNIAAFAAAPDAQIIVNAAGCGSTLKGYGHLLADDVDWAERAAAFAARVRDLSEELTEHPLPPPGSQPARTITLQEPCHLAHAQRIRQAPRHLLATIPNLQLVELADSAMCCGSAGVYNVLHRRQADALLARKVAAVSDVITAGVTTVVTANPGCQLQLQSGLAAAGTTARVQHIADLLDDAYGGVTATDICGPQR